MKCQVLLSVAVGLVIAASAVAAQPGSDDLKKLEGNWTLVGGERDGKPLPDNLLTTSSLSIDGNNHTVKLGDSVMKGTHTLDTTESPKEIDSLDTEGENKGKKLGIYELNGDEFRVCFAPTGKERPREFTTKPGSGTFVHLWRRQK